MVIEEKIKQIEVKFHNAMDALRLHKDFKWGEIYHKDEDQIYLKQTKDGFVFEDHYAIEPSNYNAYRTDKTIQVEERLLGVVDGKPNYDWDTLETQVSVKFPENVTVRLWIKSVSVDHNYARLGVSMINETFSNSNDWGTTTQVSIDWDTFQLKSREIGKIRKLIRIAYTKEEEFLNEIEECSDSILLQQESVERLKKVHAKLIEKRDRLFPMKEVA